MLLSNEFLYFAYGSNMCIERLAARTPSARMLSTGFLRGHRLKFDKLSVDGSGKCDCQHTGSEEDRVYGVLFAIANTERPSLDKAEGVGNGYDRREVAIETDGGIVNATTYIAMRKQPDLRPYHWYKDYVLTGARQAKLPVEYIAGIESVESIDDPKQDRAARESQTWMAPR